MENNKALLVILDGWGLGQDASVDALAQGHTPVFDRLWQQDPHATLITYGEEVGLPEGQMGNSEVGHLNIGAGRVVYQSFARINKAIRDGDLARNSSLQNALRLAREQGKNVHLMGLVSDGGVHSHMKHLLELCDICTAAGNEQVFIHAFTDGRDVAPTSAAGFIQEVQEHIAEQPINLATITGRFYAMDRDSRWERIAIAYNALTKGEGEVTEDPVATIKARYEQGEKDEFLKPIICTSAGRGPASITAGDVVIFFNFRTDRPRQITRALTQENFPEAGMQLISDLHFVTMTQYDENFKGLTVLFAAEELRNTIGQVVSEAGRTQVRIAETEKYAHVTFFLNGGEEAVFPGERRILIDSPREVNTYDEKPEMSAYEVTDAIVKDIQDHQPDLICLNYANTDMVGHTGDFKAAQRAAEAVDECLGRLLKAADEHGYETIIIADHGNSDIMMTPEGNPHTAHTTNPVPIIYHGSRSEQLAADGKLGDIAPTLLYLMGLSAPSEMTGKVLLSKKA